MSRWWKWAAIAVGVIAAIVVAVWLFGPIAGAGGLLSGLGALFLGRRRRKPLAGDTRDELHDLVDDGLEATEAQIAAERATTEEEAHDAIATADAKLEEEANAPVDDPLDWTRSGRRRDS